MWLPYASLVVLALLCNVSLFVSSEPTWTTLRVTWGVNLLSSRVFAKLPTTEDKARSEGFVKLAGECSNGKFLGHRYMKGLNTASILLYDENGYIAGIQNGIPKNDAEKSNASSYFASSPAYVLDKILGEEEVYFLTAYFVKPTIICNGGRSSEEYNEQHAGNALYFQNGTNPVSDSIQVPLYEKDVLNKTLWKKGQCFRTMGVHYWYNTDEDMSCRDFFPFTPIYNRGKLTNFAFVNMGKYEFSSRFEHPSASQLTSFLTTPVPKCLYQEHAKTGGFSTMHVFFTMRPWNLFC